MSMRMAREIIEFIALFILHSARKQILQAVSDI
jgi:hypothetical protein